MLKWFEICREDSGTARPIQRKLTSQLQTEPETEEEKKKKEEHLQLTFELARLLFPVLLEVKIVPSSSEFRGLSHKHSNNIIFLNGPSSASFSFIFVFSNKQYNSLTIMCEKMLWPSSIRHRDSNQRPLEHESLPITTRPGLPPKNRILWDQNLKLNKLCYFDDM